MREHSVVDRKLDIRIDVDERSLSIHIPGFDARLLIVAEFNNANLSLSLFLYKILYSRHENARKMKKLHNVVTRKWV